ncbi:MAG: Lrp/AsnC family transcriptional regulator [Candidatus Njordarchaeota archaeon]
MIRAFVMINVEVGKIAHVVEELKRIQNIENIAVVAGEFDIIVRVRVQSLEDLFEVTEKIHKINGIERTTTHVVEKEVSSE